MTITVSKITYGAVAGFPTGIVVFKINYGVVIDPNTPEPPPTSGRRRQMAVVN